jgi:hypothetical protein
MRGVDETLLDASDEIASARTGRCRTPLAHAQCEALVASTPKLAPVTIVAISNCPLMPVQNARTPVSSLPMST